MKILCIVIAGLKRNPVLSMIFWIPAYAGMTTFILFPAIATLSDRGNDSLRDFIGLTSRRQDGSG
jgi:hypothetical protein